MVVIVICELRSMGRMLSFNGLAVNVDKCLAMWLGDCSENPSYHLNNHEISSVNELKLLGVTIDKDLSFNSHVSNIVRKMNNQLQVIKRHKRFIDTNAKFLLYNAYFLPQLNYCSTVWNFCGKCNSAKLEKLNERSLRYVLNDTNFSYEELLKKVDHPSLYNRRIHDILILVYTTIHGYAPEYNSNTLTLRSNSSTMNLRGQDCLTIPRVRTTKCGLHSFSYYVSKLWNSISDSIRTLPTIKAFKLAIRGLDFSTDCCAFCN